MSMTDNPPESLEESLRIERDRVAKLKQLVLREKKTVSKLTDEIKELQTKLDASNSSRQPPDNLVLDSQASGHPSHLRQVDIAEFEQLTLKSASIDALKCQLDSVEQELKQEKRKVSDLTMKLEERQENLALEQGKTAHLRMLIEDQDKLNRSLKDVLSYNLAQVQDLYNTRKQSSVVSELLDSLDDITARFITNSDYERTKETCESCEQWLVVFDRLFGDRARSLLEEPFTEEKRRELLSGIKISSSDRHLRNGDVSNSSLSSIGEFSISEVREFLERLKHLLADDLQFGTKEEHNLTSLLDFIRLRIHSNSLSLSTEEISNILSQFSALEQTVGKVEAYVSEEVVQAKGLVETLLHKFRQSADYDKLVRDKETEICELRETCSQLSHRSAIYGSFLHSLIDFCDSNPVCPLGDALDKWHLESCRLNANDPSMSSQDLESLLSSFANIVQPLLSGHQDQCDDNSRSLDDRAEAASQTLEPSPDEDTSKLGGQLMQLSEELMDSKKRTDDLLKQLQTSQEQCSQQADKMQRMKCLLLKLKQDEAEHNKTALLLNEAKVEIESLKSKVKHESSSARIQNELNQARLANSNLLVERDVLTDRLDRLQSEFNSYKAKALLALHGSHSPVTEKPAVSNEPVSAKSAPDVMAQHTQSLKEQLVRAEQITEEAALRASVAQTECEMLREELSTLRQKHVELLKQYNEQQEYWEAKLKNLSSEQELTFAIREKQLEKRMLAEQEQLQLRLQTVSEQHKEELSKLNASWSSRLDCMTEQNKELQERLDTLKREEHEEESSGFVRNGVTYTGTTTTVCSPFSVRLQGDGADANTATVQTNDFDAVKSVDSSVWNKQAKSTAPLFLPLDRLLESDSPRLSARQSSISGSCSPADLDLAASPRPPDTKQLSVMRNALQSQQRRVEHLSELLNESEATVMRLEEQTRVLKNEIRRLERLNQLQSEFPLPSNSTEDGLTDSKDSLTRMEYLKNVIVKLVQLPIDSPERSQLVTVLSTLLLLTASEKDCLLRGTDSDRGNPEHKVSQTSWSSYIPFWKTS